MQFKDLPPLHFLPAFEAAGRLGSIKAAAAELHVTPSAVSQQLKLVEETLGSALFERRGAVIKLSSEGALYLREIQEALTHIARASQHLRDRARVRVLCLSTADFIAYEFLLPRLAAFREAFPGIELSLAPTTRVLDFKSSEVDVAIRIGDGPWPGLVAHELGPAFVTPVCSQQLATEIRTSAQLQEQTLIELRGQEGRGFSKFVKKNGGPTARPLLLFDNYLETMRAAEQGLGVALAVFPMTTDWVLDGRLAVPVPVRLPLAAKICFVHREADASDPLYTRLTDWLRKQYAALTALPAGRVVRTRAGTVREKRARKSSLR
jgi:LysR family glycine cleavage system transcriptional activator